MVGGTYVSAAFKDRLCLFVDTCKWSLLETAVVLKTGNGEVGFDVGFKVGTNISVVLHCNWKMLSLYVLPSELL